MESITEKKEFFNLRYVDKDDKPIAIAYNDYDFIKGPEAETLQLQSHQLFVRNLFNPHTKFKRLLLYHSTGTGKGLIIHSIAKLYIDYFRKMRQEPQVTILGFTEGILVKELLKFPEFGYITKVEQEELERLRVSRLERDQLRRRGLLANIKRNITDRSRGGFYKFYGYQKFALDLVIITPKGVENKIDHNYLYEDEDKFEERFNEEIEKGNAKLNRTIVESLKYGFIACDEIHNVYNARAKNIRGIAIEYVLRLLEKEDPLSAPKVLFASATPLTSSAMEIVDLMNLLIPNTGATFKRTDFFTKNGEILQGALERISATCAGYVSFLKDSNLKEYPKRLLEGEQLLEIPYLRFTPCPMSKLLEVTVAEAKKIDDDDELDSLLSSANYTLYDAVFPDPSNPKIGLYNSTKIIGSITTAPDAWKKKYEIEVDSAGNLTGNFLLEKNIGNYSPKAAELLTEVINILDRKEVGKILAYNYYVSVIGISLLREMFLYNGFLDATSAPISNTRCSICGVTMEHHIKVKDHEFKPARVLTVFGESSDVEKTLTLYNAKNNIFGYEYRVLLGSRVIHEGYDFNCIRFMYITSLPRDISTLIQVYGRAVRRRSHNLLPSEYRDVKIYTLVSTYENKQRISPELLHYKRKVDVFLKIQKIERELRKFAVDNFINYDKMLSGIDLNRPSLDGLPFKPDSSTLMTTTNLESLYKRANQESDTVSSFTSLGYGIEEQKVIIRLLKKIFMIRPIWTYEDLWIAAKQPSPELKTAFDHKLFSEHNFALALEFLVSGVYVEMLEGMDTNNNLHIPYITVGDEQRRIIYQKPFFMLVPVDAAGFPVVDLESFMRTDSTNVDLEISLDAFVDSMESTKHFDKLYRIYTTTCIDDPIMSFVKINPKFHNTIAKKIVEGDSSVAPKELLKLYEQTNFLLYIDDFQSLEIGRSYGYTNRSKPIGFRMAASAFIYVPSTNKTDSWTRVPISLFNTPEFKENNIVVGYSRINTAGDLIFKIREPIEKLESHSDRRKIKKGIACYSADSTWKKKILDKLGIKSHDSGKVKSLDACDSIMKSLLHKEIKARESKSNLTRWFYFWFDQIPVA